jgi:hypothetical protein
LREGGEKRPKMMKKSRLIEKLEEYGVIDKNLSIGAKHNKLKGLSSISIAGSDNPLVEVEYKGKHLENFWRIIEYQPPLINKY